MATSLSGLVKQFESGGDYTAQNPDSSASGAYQFTTPTWQQYAGQIGVDTGAYPTAASAPPAVQDAVFSQAVSQRGLGDWTCPNCNPALSSYVASNPSAASLPVFDTSGNTTLASNASPDYYIGHDPTTGLPVTSSDPNNPDYAAPGVTDWQPVYGGSSGSPSSLGGTATTAAGGTGIGMPITAGLQPGAALTFGSIGTNIQQGVTTAGTTVGKAISGVGTTFENFFTGWLGALENWVGRGFLILIGLVVLAIALWRIMDPSGEKTRAVMRNAEVAA